jgi:4-amino-4-deoxy-L-arabinose transferase-like glycosyltransferase
MSPRRYALALAAVSSARRPRARRRHRLDPDAARSRTSTASSASRRISRRPGRFEAKPGFPTPGRSPAYPVLLSFAFRAVPDSELAAAKAVNVALFAAAALAGAALARRLWGEAAGLWTAALLAFLPGRC